MDPTSGIVSSANAEYSASRPSPLSSVQSGKTRHVHPSNLSTSHGLIAETAKQLVAMFRKNFVKFEEHVDARVREAAPAMQMAADAAE